MAHTMTRLDDGTIELKITIPMDQVVSATTLIMEGVAQTAKVPGFRPGKAPKKMVQDSTDPAKVHEEVLKKLIPSSYIEAVQSEKIRPIVNPKIHVDEIEDGKDWSFTATTCEMPEVKLGDYKPSVKKLTAKSKIIVPGKVDEKPDLDTIVKAVVDTTTVTIPQLLVDYEVDRLLAQTLDEIKKLGLTLDQYLSSTGKTPEEVRSEYALKATNDMKLEFALQQISDTEKITVEEKEIDEAILKAKDDKERANLQGNRYLLSNIIRQQKTLDFLQNL
jgi:FKBP-type peptidyl-prolyl cis-trans isomerase (trigger factor)